MTPKLHYPTPRLARIDPIPAGIELPALLIPGVRFDGRADAAGTVAYLLELPRNTWSLPCVQETCEALGVGQPVFEHDNSSPWPPAGHHILRPYQQVAAQFMLDNRGVICGDQMGLGKSRVAAVAAVATMTAKPILILAPKYLRQSWLAELQKIGFVTEPERDFMALEGSNKDTFKWNKEARWIFCHYEILKYWWDWLLMLRPRVAILDEAHFLKNSNSVRAKAAELACGAAEYRFLLTGTPMPNRVGEMWNLLNLACGKWSFGRPLEYRKRYVGAVFDGFGHRDQQPTHVEEFRKRIELCYIRRTYADVDLELPLITREPIYVELSDKDKAKYAALLDGYDLHTVARSLAENRASKKTLQLLGRVRKLTSHAKLGVALECIQGTIDQEEDVVCFCWERVTAKRLANVKLLKCNRFLIHGGVSQKERDLHLEQFQFNGGLIAATYGALGVGVNLQRARIVILHDLDWTPATMLQAEARVWRQGQTRPVLSKWIIARGTLDEMLAELILSKADTIATILDDQEPASLEAVLGGLVAVDFEEKTATMIDNWRRWRMA